MERAGAAKGDDPEIAGVKAALDGDHTKRAQHDLVGDVDNAFGAVFGREAEGMANLCNGGFGGGDIECHVAAEKHRR